MIYSNLPHLLTIATMVCPEQVKELWVTQAQGIANFMQVDTSLFWLVNSSNEVALNLLSKGYDIFVADMTRCYKSNPWNGRDNLIDVVASINRIGYKQAKILHPRANSRIWICVDSEGKATKASWGTSRQWDFWSFPGYAYWTTWMINEKMSRQSWWSCMTPRFRHSYGISCSPLWLLHHQIQLGLSNCLTN